MVAHLFPIVNEAEPESQFSRINIDPEDKAFEDEAEAKVVKRGRRPGPKANEAAETK